MARLRETLKQFYTLTEGVKFSGTDLKIFCVIFNKKE